MKDNGRSQDDEFDIHLDEDAPAEAPEAQASTPQADSKPQQAQQAAQQPPPASAHRVYVRPGLEQPELASPPSQQGAGLHFR